MSEKFTSKSLMLEALKKDYASRLFEVLKDLKIYIYIPENPPISEEAPQQI